MQPLKTTLGFWLASATRMYVEAQTIWTPTPLIDCVDPVTVCFHNTQANVGFWQTCDMCVCNNLGYLVAGTYSLDYPRNFYTCEIRQLRLPGSNQTLTYSRCIPTFVDVAVCIFSLALFTSGVLLMCQFLGRWICLSNCRRWRSIFTRSTPARRSPQSYPPLIPRNQDAEEPSEAA
jgi:hypothetical protein